MEIKVPPIIYYKMKNHNINDKFYLLRQGSILYKQDPINKKAKRLLSIIYEQDQIYNTAKRLLSILYEQDQTQFNIRIIKVNDYLILLCNL